MFDALRSSCCCCVSGRKKIKTLSDEYEYHFDDDDVTQLSGDFFYAPLLGAADEPGKTPERAGSTVSIQHHASMDKEQVQCVNIERVLVRDGYSREQITDPLMIRRHLRGCKGDVAKAIETLKKTLEWRKENNVDIYSQIFASDTSESEEIRSIISFENCTGKTYVRGYDMVGRATVWFFPAKENSPNNGSQNLMHLLYNLERAVACTRQRTLGTDDQINFVIVFDGYNMNNAPNMTVTRETLSAIQDHYPERLHRAYLVNPPTVFSVLWNLAKPFIDSLTKKKISIVSGKNVIKKLSEQYDVRYLEKSVGGGDAREFDSNQYLTAPFYTAFGEMGRVNGGQVLDDDMFFDSLSRHSASIRSLGSSHIVL
mmetsp:Transcript_25353/g.39255  ORF Transcript_25353/g.39255 Transcript_25353/m.39255 type:complete len:370 (+) Transcript_25353:198-1307(+)